MKLVVDFETANTDPDIDLREVGAEAYAEHPATEILCLCMITDFGYSYSWRPGCQPKGFFEDLASDPEVIFEAHGAAFEQMIWKHIMVKRYGFPEIPIERWSCTQATALYRGFPGGLDKAARAVGLTQQKDMEGSDLTIGLSRPITKKAWGDDWFMGPGTKAEHMRAYKPIFDRRPATLERVMQYCMQDCRTEVELGDVTGPLSAYERRVWELDQRINQRGLKLDFAFIHQAMKVVAGATVELEAEFSQLTDGLGAGQNEKIRGWCASQGVVLDSLDKPTMKALGIGEEVDEADVSSERSRDALRNAPDVRRVLEIRSMLGSSSVKKLPRMLQCVGSDGRSRNLLQYHGAGTGRWAGRLWQPHNLPRGLVTVGGSPPDHAELYQAIMSGDHRYVRMLYGDAVKAVATGLRFAVIAEPGYAISDGDFAGIEMRVDLAMAGQHDKCALLASGADVYLDMACDIYKVPKGSLTKKDVEKRTIGKNTVLGCGFQMGGDTFHDKYCPHMPIKFAHEVVDAYRQSWAPLVPKLWRGLQDAALNAVYNQSHAESHGIAYEFVQSGMHKWLACHLPDGQTMWYYDPHIAHRAMPWDETDVRMGWSFMSWKDGQWKRIHAYGGLLTENAVQKFARGLLVEAMYRCEAAGFPIILTVHDAIMAEPLSVNADWSVFKSIMEETTAAAKAYGVPIAVEGYVGDRWRK